jgi:hypothetical protein
MCQHQQGQAAESSWITPPPPPHTHTEADTVSASCCSADLGLLDLLQKLPATDCEFDPYLYLPETQQLHECLLLLAQSAGLLMRQEQPDKP